MVEQKLDISEMLFILPKQRIPTIKRNSGNFPYIVVITENHPDLLLFRTESHIQACSPWDLIGDSPDKPYHQKIVPNKEIIPKSQIVPNQHVMANSTGECLPSSFFDQCPQETGTQFIILSKSGRNGTVNILSICVWENVVIAERLERDNAYKENKYKQNKYKRRKFRLKIRPKMKRKDYNENQRIEVASKQGQIKARNGTHFGPKTKDLSFGMNLLNATSFEMNLLRAISFGVNLITCDTYQIQPPRLKSLTLVRCDTNYIGYSFTSSATNGQYCYRSRCVETEVTATLFKMEQNNFHTDCWIACEQTKHRLVRDILYTILQIPERNRQRHSKHISCSLCDIVLHSQMFDSFLYISMVRNDVHTELH